MTRFKHFWNAFWKFSHHLKTKTVPFSCLGSFSDEFCLPFRTVTSLSTLLSSCVLLSNNSGGLGVSSDEFLYMIELSKHHSPHFSFYYTVKKCIFPSKYHIFIFWGTRSSSGWVLTYVRTFKTTFLSLLIFILSSKNFFCQFLYFSPIFSYETDNLGSVSNGGK